MADGGLDFAGWRETVDYDDPASLLMESEAEDWLRRRETAFVALSLAREIHHAPSVALFGRLHKEACEACEELGERPHWIALADAIGAHECLEYQRVRLEHFRTFMAYLAQGMERRNLADLLRNFLALARRVAPDLVGGITQAEMAALLGEDKQAAQAREKRIVELFQKRRGVSAYRALGKTATEESREKMSRAAKGNTNRARGSRRKKAEQADARAAGERALAGKNKGTYQGIKGWFRVVPDPDAPESWAVVSLDPVELVRAGVESLGVARDFARSCSGARAAGKRGKAA